MILFLEPYFEQKPWAGNQLNKLYDCKDNTGEAWIVSGISHKSSVIKNGIFKGKSLRYVYNKYPELFDNFPSKEFPLLLKLISANQDLSIQVHPNDEYASKNYNSLGKFECWYILEENTSEDVVLGIKAKNVSEIKNYLQNNVIENYLVHKSIRQNNLVVVEPGMVHAIKKGAFVLEVQEASDLTFRLYDYNRLPRRDLHIDESLNVINYNFEKNNIHDFSREDTFKNEHFNIYKLHIKNMQIYENKGFEIFYCLNGSGKVNNIEVKKGDSFIFTSETEKIFVEGNFEFIACIPKVKKEIVKLRKIALITGITSQTGSYLAEFLLSKNYEVHGLLQYKVNLETKNNEDYLYNIKNKNLSLHVGDLLDASNLNQLIENIKPDEVYHLAGQSHVDLSFDLPELTTNVNALGTLRILEAIKRSESHIKFFNLSTCQLFKGDVYPQTEQTKFEPTSPYAISKLYAHYMVSNYRDNYRIFAVNGICYNQESPRREKNYLSKKVCDYLKNLKNNPDEILYLGNLDSVREWGHAKDYAEAMWLALNQDSATDYIISTGETMSVRDFVRLAFQKMGYEISWKNKGIDEIGINQYGKVMIKISKEFLRPIEAKVLVGDSTKFKNKTGWIPKYDINRLLDEMLED